MYEQLAIMPEFCIFARTIKNNCRILHDICPENARILHDNCPKNISPILGGIGHVPDFFAVSCAYAERVEKQTSYQGLICRLRLSESRT